MARQEGLEPPAYCLEGSCSIQLSYWRMGNPCPIQSPPESGGTISAFHLLSFSFCEKVSGAGDGNRTHVFSLEG